jgi:hypothetical protein
LAVSTGESDRLNGAGHARDVSAETDHCLTPVWTPGKLGIRYLLAESSRARSIVA